MSYLLCSAEHAVEVLNRVHKADPTVLPQLIGYRVPANQELADDPTVQVLGGEGPNTVGMLGILNGIFGVNQATKGYIIANFDENNTLVGFEVRELE